MTDAKNPDLPKVEKKVNKPTHVTFEMKGQILPMRVKIQNPNDPKKAKRGMKCMQMLRDTVVKSKFTGLSYTFPKLKPVWVHKNDVNLCASKGAAAYDESIDK